MVRIIIAWIHIQRLPSNLLKEHTDRLNVNPDIYQMGIKMFIENDNFHKLFEFISLFIQRFYSDAHLQKCMKKYINRVIL